MKIRQKIMTRRVLPFKVAKGHLTLIDRRLGLDFLLVLLVYTRGPVFYRFRDKLKRRFRSKIANFSPPREFTRPPLREFCLEFCNSSSAQKLVMLLPVGEKSLHLFQYNIRV